MILCKSDIEIILRKYKSGEVSEQQLEEWANFIECRDDIGFEESREETLREIIYWLANPELGYEVNSNLISEIEKGLESNAL